MYALFDKIAGCSTHTVSAYAALRSREISIEAIDQDNAEHGRSAQDAVAQAGCRAHRRRRERESARASAARRRGSKWSSKNRASPSGALRGATAAPAAGGSERCGRADLEWRDVNPARPQREAITPPVRPHAQRSIVLIVAVVADNDVRFPSADLPRSSCCERLPKRNSGSGFQPPILNSESGFRLRGNSPTTPEEIQMFTLPTEESELALWEVTANDVLAVEHFADSVLRDDFFFRKGHWLSLVADSRVQLLVVRVRPGGQPEWSEICGVVVLYADSILHNLFLARQWRALGLGSAIIEAVSPSKIRAKVDMSSGDPSDFYARLGFTHEEARKGKRGQIRVLTKMSSDNPVTLPIAAQPSEPDNPEAQQGDVSKGSGKGRKRS